MCLYANEEGPLLLVDSQSQDTFVAGYSCAVYNLYDHTWGSKSPSNSF